MAGNEGYDPATAVAYQRLLAHQECTSDDRQSYLYYLLNNGRMVDIMRMSDSALSGDCWGKRGGCEDVAVAAAEMLLLSGDRANARIIVIDIERRVREPKVRERARKLLEKLSAGR